MSDPTDAIRDILGMPEFSAKVTPISPPRPTGPTMPAFIPAPDPIDAHDDDHAADADGDWTPDPRDLA